MKQAFIIHGYGGNKDGHWFPWLKSELEKFNFHVDNPQFPNTDHPQVQEWTQTINDLWKPELKSTSHSNKPTFRTMIGHSLGGTEILKSLELDWTQPLDLAIIIAAPNKKVLEDSEFTDLKNFFEQDFDWKKIQRNCKKFILIFSDNDPYVQPEVGEYYQHHLGGTTELFMLNNAGHFMKRDGFEEFPMLLELIKKY